MIEVKHEIEKTCTDLSRPGPIFHSFTGNRFGFPVFFFPFKPVTASELDLGRFRIRQAKKLVSQQHTSERDMALRHCKSLITLQHNSKVYFPFQLISFSKPSLPRITRR